MKKVVGIFIVMMIVAIMAAVAFGENLKVEGVYYGYGDEAQSLVERWANDNGGEQYVEHYTEDGIFRFCGALDIGEYENYFGNAFTWEHYEEQVRREYEMVEFKIYMIGKIDNYNIYLIEGLSESDIEDGYKMISIMTMLFKQ